MREFFGFDGGFIQLLERIANLFILNILCLICCIPVITAGASFTALYYVTLKMARNEECYIVRQFFKAFKENFKSATLIWCAALILSACFALDFRLLLSLARTGAISFALRNLLFTALGVVFILFAFTASFIFPLTARFENTVPNLVKFAFVLSVRHFPTTLVVIILFSVLPFMIIFMGLIKWTVPMLFFFGLSLAAYFSSFLFLRVFKNYEGSEETKTQ